MRLTSPGTQTIRPNSLISKYREYLYRLVHPMDYWNGLVVRVAWPLMRTQWMRDNPNVTLYNKERP